jgi:hypothetical protein
MDTTKYVVVKERMVDAMGDPIENDDGYFIDKEILYIFPCDIVHRDFARKIAPRSRWVGAGFVGKQENGVHFCYGRSESMGVDSRAEDTTLLHILLGEF